MTDVELLNLHRNGSESAFPDLVRRHLTWIYSLARRRLGDSHLAEDVAQAVFILLHRKSPQFTADRAMMTWLYKTACYASDSAARGERRRQIRETKAAMQNPEAFQSPETPPETQQWHELAPILDKLIGQLSRPDREAILLRYYRDLPLAEIARQIGTTPDAARKRIECALEKLRHLAAQKGSPLSAASLATCLATFVRVPPPAGLIATATTAATAPATSALATTTSAIVKGALTAMSTAKITAVSIAAVALIAVAGAVCTTIWILSSAPPSIASTPAASPPPTTQISPRAETLLINVDANGAPVSIQRPTGQILFAASNAQMPKLAPYNAIRWHGQSPEVQINSTWYQLIAINNIPVTDILTSREIAHDPDPLKHKHFGEDIVQLLTLMGHAPGQSVNLQLQALGPDKNILTLQNVPMTEDNRLALMNSPAPGQTSLFHAHRWIGSQPQIQQNDTWYDLLAIDDVSVSQIYDAAKSAWGNNWQDHSAIEMLAKAGHPIHGEAIFRCRTLDSNEIVTFSVRVPMRN